MRSSVEGWVLKSRTKLPPEKGLMMNMWAVAGEPAVIGTCWLHAAILRSALARANGLPEILAPVASAINSREREIAICMSVAAIGAMITPTKPAMG